LIFFSSPSTLLGEGRNSSSTGGEREAPNKRREETVSRYNLDRPELSAGRRKKGDLWGKKFRWQKEGQREKEKSESPGGPAVYIAKFTVRRRNRTSHQERKRTFLPSLGKRREGIQVGGLRLKILSNPSKVRGGKTLNPGGGKKKNTRPESSKEEKRNKRKFTLSSVGSGTDFIIL